MAQTLCRLLPRLPGEPGPSTLFRLCLQRASTSSLQDVLLIHHRLLSFDHPKNSNIGQPRSPQRMGTGVAVPSVLLKHGNVSSLTDGAGQGHTQASLSLMLIQFEAIFSNNYEYYE